MATGYTALHLRCPLEETHSFEYTVPSGGVSAGDFVLTGEVIGVWAEDYDAADTGVVIYKAPKILVPCAVATTSVNYAVGEPVYADIADNEVNQTTSGNTLCGIVLVAPAVGAETVEIELDGMLDLTRGT
ncbi:MAG: DUF2190 family protein [Patescibacteria group bacterium]